MTFRRNFRRISTDRRVCGYHSKLEFKFGFQFDSNSIFELETKSRRRIQCLACCSSITHSGNALLMAIRSRTTDHCAKNNFEASSAGLVRSRLEEPSRLMVHEGLTHTERSRRARVKGPTRQVLTASGLAVIRSGQRAAHYLDYFYMLISFAPTRSPSITQASLFLRALAGQLARFRRKSH